MSNIHFERFYLDTFYQKIFWSLSHVHSTLLKVMYHNLVKEHPPPTFGPTYRIGSKFTQISIHSTACVLCSKLRVTNHVEHSHKCHTQRPETLRFTSESSKVITREFCVDTCRVRCSVQSENLCNLKIVLYTLRILRLRSNLERTQSRDCIPISRLRKFSDCVEQRYLMWHTL